MGRFLVLVLALASKEALAAKTYTLEKPLSKEGWELRALPSRENASIVQGIGGRKGPAVRFILNPGEIAIRAPRAELTDSFQPPLNKPIHYKFSVFIPENYTQLSRNSNVIAQWQTQRPLKPVLAFRYRDSRLDITMDHFNRGTSDPKLSGQISLARIKNFPRGKWQDVEVAALWVTGTNGHIRVWMNGEQVADYKGQTTYEGETMGPYFKYGMYFSRPVTAPVFVYHGPYWRSLE